MASDFDYNKCKKVYDELEGLDIKTSKDKFAIARSLCEKNGILFSELLLYINYEFGKPILN